MSTTGLQGVFGFKKQSAVGTAASGPYNSGWNWIPANTVNFQPQQMVQAIQPEVGGQLFSRGSYKGGVHGEGQVMFIPRGGLGLAEMFRGFCGSPIGVDTKLDTEFDGSTDLPTGVFRYIFTPLSGASAELPWYTMIRNVGGKFVEQFTDTRIGNFAFDLAATNILNIDASFISKGCATIAAGSGATSVGAQVAGNGPVFQSIDAVVKLDTVVGGEPGPVDADEALNPTRLNIGFANQLSNNEHVVGSYYLQDVTNQARTANVTYSVYLKNADLYSRTYSYGSDAAAGAAWSPKVWKGALELTMTSGANISGESIPYSIKVSIPEMDYMATPISLAGNQLVEYQLTTNVVLSTDPSVNPFTIEYITDEDIS